MVHELCRKTWDRKDATVTVGSGITKICRWLLPSDYILVVIVSDTGRELVESQLNYMDAGVHETKDSSGRLASKLRGDCALALSKDYVVCKSYKLVAQ